MKKELIQKVKRTVDEALPDSTADSPHGSFIANSPGPGATPCASSQVPADPVTTPVTAKKPTRRKKVLRVEEVREPSIPIISDARDSPSAGNLSLSPPTMDVCSPTPSAAASCSSVEFSATDLASYGLTSDLLSVFEKQKIIELIKANEVMNESNPDEETSAGEFL